METSKSLVRSINERNVLQQIFNYGPISRSQVSKNLKLNKVTVSDIFSNLDQQNFLEELGEGNSTKNGGRKPTLLRFNTNLGYTVSLDFGYNFVDRMINLLDGTLIQFDHYSFDQMAIKDRIELLITKVRDIEAPKTINGLCGISVAIHGIVSGNKVVLSPFIDMEDYDIADILMDEFKVPVILENEANLAVVYERDFNTQRNNGNIICVSIHKGIGAGIVIDNHLYRGFKGEAGEIGHTVISDREIRKPSEVETIEDYCSEDAILAKIQQSSGNKFIERKDIKRRYTQNDSEIIGILDEFCFYTANTIYNTIISFDPGRVVINSNLVADIPELLEKIKHNIRYLTSYQTPVALISDVQHATLLGGCSVITHHVLRMKEMQLMFRN